MKEGKITDIPRSSSHYFELTPKKGSPVHKGLEPDPLQAYVSDPRFGGVLRRPERRRELEGKSACTQVFLCSHDDYTIANYNTMLTKSVLLALGASTCRSCLSLSPSFSLPSTAAQTKSVAARADPFGPAVVAALSRDAAVVEQLHVLSKRQSAGNSTTASSTALSSIFG